MMRVLSLLLAVSSTVSVLTGPNNRVLVTGGAGYIGSHTVLQLLQEGIQVLVADNLSNSARESLDRVVELAGCEPSQLVFVHVDLRIRSEVAAVIDQHSFDACIHFAGLKAVGESVAEPLQYYENNIAATTILLQELARVGCKKLVFSSSATVYGFQDTLPVPETAPLSATNPYGRTKLYIEAMLQDLYKSDPSWSILIFRYFNPIGAHPSGRIGEDPQGKPNNLMPYIAQVAVKRRPKLRVFGSDYETPDGTGVRDYIHVMDLATGHLAGLKKITATDASEKVGCVAVNLGTGRGVSVLELINGMRQASGKEIPFDLAPRRPGDVAACYCDPSKAAALLGWKAERTVADMCADTWRWQSMNPQGYRKPVADANREDL